ncbi:DUF6879 family protein [Actinoplanes sp. RD1]|uniref:DUF6879 family protein n=1 Tax=Actinoplanes sp. RD1 TaxID=3064538 RepID=UPI0027408A81|nr:DUF6879 family protein [Actinoplanes sp. RD1]
MTPPPPALAPPPSVARKILTTVATGGLTFLITNAANLPQDTSLTLSVLIGGIALLIRFLIDFDRRLGVVERLARDGLTGTRKLVTDAFGDISEATDLHRMIGLSSLGEEVIRNLVRNAVLVPAAAPEIIHRFVRARIAETSELLKQVSDGGTVTYYGEDREWLLGLTRNATASIDAISLAAVDHSLWQSETGQRYLDAQRVAAADGTKVRRIFVLDTAADAGDKDLALVCSEQVRLGIDVRLLVRDDVPQQLRVHDLIVFDDTLAYEMTPTSSDPQLAQIAETRLVLTEYRVQQCVQLFRELWEVSREPEPPGDQTKT